jgi:hypothetical protein
LTPLRLCGMVAKLVFVTDSDKQRQKAVTAALDGSAPVPRTKAQQVAVFELLRDVPGVTNPMLAKACNVGHATVKRWKRHGTKDLRAPHILEGIAKREAREAGVYAHLSDPGTVIPPAAKVRAPPPPLPAGPADAMTAEELIGKVGHDLTSFDAIVALKRIAISSGTPRPLRVRCLSVIAQHENQKGRIPWEAIKADQIPVEVQHRLAGMLLHLVQLDELPEAVKLASPARRRVYRLLGLLPATDALADRVLERYQALAAELRAELEPEAASVELPPLVVSLAVQAGRAPR